nr:serine:threonine protein phosphatase 2A [Hymenolepis microstoma]
MLRPIVIDPTPFNQQFTKNANKTLLTSRERREAKDLLLGSKSAQLPDDKDLDATIFAKLSHGERFSRVKIHDFFAFVKKTVWLQQTRISISNYNLRGDGYLQEEDLET